MSGYEVEVLSEVVDGGELKRAACLGEIGVAQHPFFPRSTPPCQKLSRG